MDTNLLHRYQNCHAKRFLSLSRTRMWLDKATEYSSAQIEQRRTVTGEEPPIHHGGNH
jgi:hypothetical protein